MKQRPLTGIGVMILKYSKVLMGKRYGSHGAHTYSFPGGHLELGESFIDCIVREVLEEARIEIENIRYLCCANILTYTKEDPRKHYVHLGFVADWKSGEPYVPDSEAGTCGEWVWYDFDDLPHPLFEPAAIMIDSYINNAGRRCHDSNTIIECYSDAKIIRE